MVGLCPYDQEPSRLDVSRRGRWLPTDGENDSTERRAWSERVLRYGSRQSLTECSSSDSMFDRVADRRRREIDEQ